MSMFITKSLEIITPRHVRTVHNRCRIGNRDWVGFGHNGSANYKDDAHFPFPAVRFKENTRDIWALREKEKGDWKCLCCEEKKALYRSSFCQTFSEFQHPTGLWKVVLGCVLLGTSFTFWAAMFHHYYVFEPLPASLSKESQKMQLRRMLELRMNPVDGLASKWDYDNDRWKPGCEPLTLNQKMQLRRMLELCVNPIDGLTSKWDYNNDRTILGEETLKFSACIEYSDMKAYHVMNILN